MSLQASSCSKIMSNLAVAIDNPCALQPASGVEIVIIERVNPLLILVSK